MACDRRAAARGPAFGLDDEVFDAVDGHFLMGDEHHDAARPDMLAHEVRKAGDAAHVERGEGLVENPERHGAGKPEAGERDAAALALRELARGHVDEVGQAHGVKCVKRGVLRDGHGRHVGIDHHVLEHRQVVLDAVAVSDVAELAPEVLGGLLDGNTPPAYLTLDGTHEARHQSQKRRLARTVAAGDAHERAGLHGEREIPKKRPLPALAGKAADFKNGF